MTLFFTLIFLFLYYVRPLDGIPGLAELRIPFFTAMLALLSLGKDFLSGRARLFDNGSDLMIIGFFLAILLSYPANGWTGGMVVGFQAFLPSFAGYMLVTHSLQTTRQVRLFIAFLLCFFLLISIEGIIEAHAGRSLLGVQPLLQRVEMGDLGDDTFIMRIKWLGTLADPNDLALALVTGVPFLLNYIWSNKSVLAFIALCIILYAIYLTNSRGAFLSLAVGVMTYTAIRTRNFKGFLIGALVVLLLMAFGPSRMGSMSSSEESAHERLEAWYAGYQMFKSAPLLGVGKGGFIDYHEITAHNSYVLVMAELGLIGSSFFVGLFYYPIRRCYRIVAHNYPLPLEARNLLTAAISALAALMTSMFFLSRAYVLEPLIVVGLLTAIIRCAMSASDNHHFDLFTHPLRDIFILNIGMLLAINVILKIFM